MIKLNVKTYGEKQNHPLLMLHGFMGESSDYDFLSEKLQKSFYCIAIDLPGHGQTKTELESDYTIEKTVEAILQFLENKNIHKPHLLGYSMGGRVAFHLLAKHPSLFSKVILESTTPGLKTKLEQDERVQKDLLLAKRMNMQPIEQFLDDWYNLDLFSSIDKNSDAFKKMITRKSKNSITQLQLSLKYFGTGVMPSLWNSLETIQSETLLITGGLDKKYCSIAQEICGLNEKFSHEIIDGASHNVHFEKEDLYYKLVDNFLK